MHILPTLFVSHGAPDFALHPGRIGPQLTALGQRLPRPRALLVVSPHWITPSPRVTTSSRPSTIHDYQGFEPALREIRYPAPGAPDLARQAIGLLRAAGWAGTRGDDQRGLDHGAWVPLLHLYPAADIPVAQVSLPATLDGDTAFAYGQALASLAHDGVLIIGSGSLTHNLHEVFGGARDADYAHEFSQWIREAATAGDIARLCSALERAPHAGRAHPTPEHYWPLVVAAGAAGSPPATVLEGGMTWHVLVMDAFVFGKVGAA